MRLITYRKLNHRYFEKGSGPAKKEWEQAILTGEINGKVVMGKVWIDLDDFLSRDCFSIGNNQEEELDLLHG